jgi:hypothetical protein
VGAADLDARGVDDGAGFALVDGAQLCPRCETDVAERERAGASDEVPGELAAGDLFLGGGLVGEVPLPDRCGNRAAVRVCGRSCAVTVFECERVVEP